MEEQKLSDDKIQGLLNDLKNVNELIKEKSFRQAREELWHIYENQRDIPGIDSFFFVFIVHFKIGVCEFKLGRLKDDSENYANALFNFEIANTFAQEKKWQDLSMGNIIKITKFLFSYDKASSDLEKTHDLVDMILEHKNLFELYTEHNHFDYEKKLMPGNNFIMKFGILFISNQVDLLDDLHKVLSDYKEGKNDILSNGEYEKIKKVLTENKIYKHNPDYLYNI